MKRATGTQKGLLVLAVIAVSALASAGSLSKLPEELNLAKSEKSPGQVVFRHTTHVKSKTADCTACHPGAFKITKSGTASGDPITHKRMSKGEYCGACHNGDKSFGLDECDSCHQEEE